MLERYRTLAAMANLPQFTVAELAELSGVGEATVRTVLKRDGFYLEPLGPSRSGKRGGQPLVYRVRTDKRAELQQMLKTLDAVRTAGAGLSLSRETVAMDEPIPAELLLAEDVLLRRVPAAGGDEAEQLRLIELANANYLAGVKALQSFKKGSHRPGDVRDPAHGVFHARVVEFLLSLAHAELTGMSINQGLQLRQQWNEKLLPLFDEVADVDLMPLMAPVLRRVHSLEASLTTRMAGSLVEAGTRMFQLRDYEAALEVLDAAEAGLGYREEVASFSDPMRSLAAKAVHHGRGTSAQEYGEGKLGVMSLKGLVDLPEGLEVQALATRGAALSRLGRRFQASEVVNRMLTRYGSLNEPKMRHAVAEAFGPSLRGCRVGSSYLKWSAFPTGAATYLESSLHEEPQQAPVLG